MWEGKLTRKLEWLSGQTGVDAETLFVYFFFGVIAFGLIAWLTERLLRAAWRRKRRASRARRAHTAQWRRWLSAVSGEGQGERQRTIARLEPGMPLRLVRDPGNPDDPSAIRVQTMSGADCGWIPRGKNERLADQMDAGAEVRASVARITGGVRGRPSLGLVIEIALRR